MNKWKWWLAAKVPAKFFVINENGDYSGSIAKTPKPCELRAGPHGPLRRGRGPYFPAPAGISVRRVVFVVVRRHRASAAIAAPETHMKIIQVTKLGGPEELKFADAPIPVPAAGQALVRIAATGVNFIDVYFRTGFIKPIYLIQAAKRQAQWNLLAKASIL